MPKPHSKGRMAGALLAFLPCLGCSAQIAIRRVALLPDLPAPYHLRDWRKTALDFDKLAFESNLSGPYLPLIWRVKGVPNLGDSSLSRPGFGMPSYVGQESTRGQAGEAITQLGALLGGTAVGLDKSDWVELAPQFLNPTEGLILNNVGGRSGGSFWYELLPSLDFVQLASRYPKYARGREISRQIAKSWLVRLDALGGNFDHTSIDPVTLKPIDNGMWHEPDASAAVAYLELTEGLKSGESKYLAGARRALKSFQGTKFNPTYEVLSAYGVLAAAFLNAERGDHWDTNQLMNWCFEPTSPNRTGWGMILGNWGGYDVGGLMGSTTDDGGYAFAMNTYLNAATLAPVARYDSRYSASLAKWILNLTNSARLYYPDELPAANQSSSDWKGDPCHGLAYEGLRASWAGKSPFAAGDAKRSGWAKTDFGMYGSGYVGLLGALVQPTNVPMILKIDLRATDFLPERAYPTSLYWNPYSQSKKVTVDLGSGAVRPYDAVSHRFLSAGRVKSSFTITLASHQAAQIVLVPASKKAVVRSGNRELVDGVVIDFAVQ